MHVVGGKMVQAYNVTKSISRSKASIRVAKTRPPEELWSHILRLQQRCVTRRLQPAHCPGKDWSYSSLCPGLMTTTAHLAPWAYLDAKSSIMWGARIGCSGQSVGFHAEFSRLHSVKWSTDSFAFSLKHVHASVFIYSIFIYNSKSKTPTKRQHYIFYMKTD